MCWRTYPDPGHMWVQFVLGYCPWSKRIFSKLGLGIFSFFLKQNIKIPVCSGMHEHLLKKFSRSSVDTPRTF